MGVLSVGGSLVLLGVRTETEQRQLSSLGGKKMKFVPFSAIATLGVREEESVTLSKLVLFLQPNNHDIGESLFMSIVKYAKES